MVVHFEYYVIITLLAASIAYYRWRTFLTGVLVCPHAIAKYLQYAFSPENYRFRIFKHLLNPVSAWNSTGALHRTRWTFSIRLSNP